MGGEIINHYSGERGAIENEELMRQPTDFSGMLFEGRTGKLNVTPTDIDGFIELEKDNAIIIFELKYSGDMPLGQETALCSLIDKLEKSGCNATLILAEHRTKAPNVINAKEARTVMVYFQKKMYRKCFQSQNQTLYETMKRFVAHVREKA